MRSPSRFKIAFQAVIDDLEPLDALDRKALLELLLAANEAGALSFLRTVTE